MVKFIRQVPTVSYLPPNMVPMIPYYYVPRGYVGLTRLPRLLTLPPPVGW